MSCSPAASLIIRPATRADVPAVARLHAEHLRYHERYDPRYHPRPLADIEAVHRLYLRSPGTVVLLAVVDEPVAFSLCRLEGGPPTWLAALGDRLAGRRRAVHGCLVDFFVAETWRRRGVGRRLVAASLEWFDHHGATGVELGVLVANEAGRAFWEALGFRPYRLQMERYTRQEPLG